MIFVIIFYYPFQISTISIAGQCSTLGGGETDWILNSREKCNIFLISFNNLMKKINKYKCDNGRM